MPNYTHYDPDQAVPKDEGMNTLNAALQMYYSRSMSDPSPA